MDSTVNEDACNNASTKTNLSNERAIGFFGALKIPVSYLRSRDSQIELFIV